MTEIDRDFEAVIHGSMHADFERRYTPQRPAPAMTDIETVSSSRRDVMTVDLVALKEALAKMTPGVWYAASRKIHLCDAPLAPIAEAFGYQQAYDDAAGIVMLHNSADAMIARIEALEAENARLRSDLQAIAAIPRSEAAYGLMSVLARAALKGDE
jgi:hypothetical protein